MKRSLKLYWVETPAWEENAFVVARSNRAAARFEESGTGFEGGSCRAELVKPVDDLWVNEYCSSKKPGDAPSVFYVYFKDLHQLGVEWRRIEGDDVFVYEGCQYVKQGDHNFLASLYKNPTKMIIRSVADLLEVIARDAPGDWIFRGHALWSWNLEAGVHRLSKGLEPDLESMISFEKRILNEFKRRSRIFLQSRPSSDWEWMVLAQHFGLPTRILDWTENPLVALYFAVTGGDDRQDGMLYAYRHGRQEVDIESAADPFAIERIELIRPPHLDQRVIAQQSIFTAEPARLQKDSNSEGSDVRYWHVSTSSKPQIRDELTKLGISESALFPGLTSLAAEIRGVALKSI